MSPHDQYPALEGFFRTIPYAKAREIGPRRFVKEYLIPAMRREHGAGFAMSAWRRDTSTDEFQGLDELYGRPTPACHSIMCIGGTMQAVTGARSDHSLARLLGIPLNADEGYMDANHLFYVWQQPRGPWAAFFREFADAETPQEKERIAEKAIWALVRHGEKLAKARERAAQASK